MQLGAHDAHPLGLGGGQGREALGHTTVEGVSGPLQAVGAAAAAHARAHGLLGRHKQNGGVGYQAVAGEAVRRRDEGAVQPPARPLVGHGGVEEAVAQHHGAPRQSRRDHLVDDLGPSRLVNEQLGPVAHGAVGRIQHHAPQGLPNGCAARLAQTYHLAAGPFQQPGQKADLGRFPRPVTALEGDEQSAAVLSPRFSHS